ncbi:MAG: Gfo/Idh/MocA family oxidoreductase, partial [Chloroflexi bacterium]|nr:Gfo/Idh/MocA family oxidoreductase [Chloroflexota bacterium]
LATPSAALVGIASRSAQKAEEFRSHFNLDRAYGSYEELVDDPAIQAIYCPLSNDLHAEWMIRAAERGKHTLCEKPFTLNAAQAQDVAEAARRCRVNVMEAFMWRFHPQHERARSAIVDGTIGTVRLVRAAFTFQMGRSGDFRWNPAFGGGSVYDVGCYTTSAARFYFGAEPSTIYARGTFDPESGIDLSMAAVVEFGTGVGLMDCGFHLPGRSDLEIAGDKGAIRIPEPWLPPDEAVIVINGKEEHLAAANQYVNEFEAFSQAVLTGSPPSYGAEDAVRQMQALDAVLASMKSGRAERVGEQPVERADASKDGQR